MTNVRNCVTDLYVPRRTYCAYWWAFSQGKFLAIRSLLYNFLAFSRGKIRLHTIVYSVSTHNTIKLTRNRLGKKKFCRDGSRIIAELLQFLKHIIVRGSDILSHIEPNIGNLFSTLSCILVSLHQISRS